MVLLSLLPLALAATPAAAQRYSPDCLVRPNSRGGTYISCSHRNDYARESRQIATRARNEARALANRVRAESRSIATRARAEARVQARTFEQQFRTFNRSFTLRERFDTPRYHPPRIRVQRW
jgi:hypothetical protein